MAAAAAGGTSKAKLVLLIKTAQCAVGAVLWPSLQLVLASGSLELGTEGTSALAGCKLRRMVPGCVIEGGLK